MKRFLIIPVLIGLISLSALQAQNQEAKLTLILPKGTESISVDYDGQLALIDKNYLKYPATKNDAGQWNVSIPLEKPQYFLLARNVLYLSPGDNLTIEVNQSYPERSNIKGKGAEVNNYLKKRLYTKGGSYLKSGDTAIVKITWEETLVVINREVAKRQQELAELNADPAFKEMEAIRIKADFANSLFKYPDYSAVRGYFFGKKATEVPKDEYYARVDQYFHEDIKAIVQPVLDEISKEDRFLDLDVVRLTLIFYSTMKNSPYEVKSERFNELFAVANESNYIRGSINKEEYQKFVAFGETIKSQELKDIYEDRLKRNTKFVEGAPAIDGAVNDLKGEKKQLSDYKGSVMYVDVWATWCGPCRKESPIFKTLSGKYENIRFVAVSVDEKKATWDKFVKDKDHGQVTELWSDDPAFQKKWEISGIPRFLLIDKDFTIISADAPRPSETEKIEAILNKYNQN